MEPYQSEDEQVEALKKWWKKNGTSTIFGIALGLAAVGGWQAWNSHQKTQSSIAASQFQQVVSLLGGQNTEQAKAISDGLMQNHQKRAYSSMAALMMARSSFEQGNIDDALTYLRWVEAHSGQDEYRDIARLRRARLIAEQGKYDEALSLVREKPAAPFAGLYADLEGDLLLAKSDYAGAQSAYNMALTSLNQPNMKVLVQMKLDNLPQ